MVDGDDKNDMGYLYEAMDRAKMKLQQSLPRDYKKCWKIIDHRWHNTLHHDLHAAGYFLNPRLTYADNANVDGEVLQCTLNVIGHLSLTPEKRLEAQLQMDAYKMKTGIYSDSQLQYAIGRVSSVEWWVMAQNRHLGNNALAFIAIRVLRQTTSASQCERNWSTFNHVHSKIRNRLKAERLDKLVYCHYNMRLRIKNMRLRQQLRDKCQANDTTGQIDVDALFDNDNPLQSWVKVREEIDDPIVDLADTT
ncbi:hypothetical protein Taro_003545 [Colocasia esculenta]|uniref:HAT C-terminal dimerisation domain-containing protein n=1 Tax=Colocasia esculenta TaxID=4460 RepID=A0A843TME3_COLES|nr:hypothetical protein [Colocasia esculenta]